MTDDKDEDASDWLASQFDPTTEIPKPPVVPPAAAQPPAAARPAATPPAAASPPAAAPAAGGFTWGLRPGGKAEEPPAATPAAATPPPPVTPQPVTPQPVTPQPVTPQPVTPQPVTPPPAAPTPVAPAEPPIAQPTVVPPPAAQPPAVQPPVARPREVPPAAVVPPPFTPPAVPPPLVEPSEDLPGPPTQAMTQPLAWDDLPQSDTPPAPSIKPDWDAADQATQEFTVEPWEPAAASADPDSAPPAWMTPAVLAADVAPVSAVPVTPTPVTPPVTVPANPADPADPTSAIDALFGDQQFQEYEDLGVLQTISPPVSPEAGDTVAYQRPTVERAPLSRTQKILLIVAGCLVAVTALVALFFLGQKLGAASATAPVAVPSGASSSVPNQAPSSGLAAPGVHPFNALMGGECVTPFTSAWAATYTVVDCSADHAAQLIFKGTLPDAATASYPNGAAFKTEITPLCSAPTALDYSAAKAVTDLQVSFSYPPTASDWNSGDRTYYCFVNRASGGTLTGSLAGTQK